jgi:hypothetical protein
MKILDLGGLQGETLCLHAGSAKFEEVMLWTKNLHICFNVARLPVFFLMFIALTLSATGCGSDKSASAVSTLTQPTSPTQPTDPTSPSSPSSPSSPTQPTGPLPTAPTVSSSVILFPSTPIGATSPIQSVIVTPQSFLRYWNGDMPD